MKGKVKIFNNNAMTLIEVIIAIVILEIVICPLMSMIVIAQKINNKSAEEYKSFQQAQGYMEEIKAMNFIDTQEYPFNSLNNSYEKKINQTVTNYAAEIKITSDESESNILYNIEIKIINNSKVLKILIGTKLFY